MVLAKQVYNYMGNFNNITDYVMFENESAVHFESDRTNDLPYSIAEFLEKVFPSRVDLEEFIKDFGWERHGVGISAPCVKIVYLDEMEEEERCSPSIRYRFGNEWCTGREILSSLKKVLIK